MLYSNEAEKEILAAAMSDKETVPEIVELVKVSDFQNPKNQLIYSKIMALYTAGQDISPISVYTALQGSNGEVGLSDLTEIQGSTASPKAFKTYAKIVTDYAKKRAIRTICERTLAEIETAPSDRIAEKLSGDIYELSKETAKQTIESDSSLMMKTLDYIQLACDTKGEGVGMKTGWKVFDAAVGGFEKGSLTIIGGRPGSGKTAFTLALADKLGKKGYRSLIAEMEMTFEMLGVRRTAAKALVSMTKIKAGKVTPEEMKLLTDAANEIACEDMILTDITPSQTLAEIRNKVRRIKQSSQLDFLFIDHMTLMDHGDGDNQHLKLSATLKGFRAIAKEYGIAVVILWQLNRSLEQRGDKRPMLADLRDSGSAEEDSDLILFMYRDAYYSRDEAIREQDHQELEVILGKNRNGKVGTLKFDFSMRTQYIAEPETWRVGS